jgi:hypothetical protein
MRNKVNKKRLQGKFMLKKNKSNKLVFTEFGCSEGGVL